MNIGIDCRPLQWWLKGGVAEYMRHLIPALVSSMSGHTFKGLWNSWNNESIQEFPGVHAIRRHIPNKIFNPSLRFLNYPKLDELLGGSDIVFLPNLNFAAVSGRARMVITVHDLSFEHLPECFNWKKRLWHKAIAPRRLLARADHIVAVSRHTAEDAQETYGIPASKITIIGTGIPEAVARPEEIPLPLAWNIQEPYLFFVGTIEPRKNVEGLIEAFEMACKEFLPREIASTLQLVIAGHRGWGWNRVMQVYHKSPVRSQIRILGPVTDAEKQSLLRHALAFVYPSFYEGIGLPVLEAARAGTPVITSSVTSLPEVMGDAALLVNPWNVTDIARAIGFMVLDEKLRQSYIEKGKARAAMYQWKNAATKLVEVFEKLK